MCLMTFTTILIGLKYRKGFQLLPSITWFFAMIIPMIYSKQFFTDNLSNLQLKGIFLVTAALCSGDLLAIYVIKNSITANISRSELNLRPVLLVGVTLVLVLPIVHFILAGTPPLITRIFGDTDSILNATNREIYTKFSIPYLLKLLTNWVINFIGPALIIKLFLMKKYKFGALLTIWCLFYASASTAQMPVIIFVCTLLFGSFFILGKNYKNLVTAGLIAIFLVITLFGIQYGNSILQHKNECQVPSNVALTPGNINRSCAQKIIIINPIVDHISYRFFLTPIEVSNKWYEYYGSGNHEQRSIVDLVDRSASVQAANKIGVWGFQTPFPERYLSSVSAYASIDADAFSFFGLISVFFVAFLLLLVRVFISIPVSTSNDFARIFQGIAFGQLVIFPFQASLQAMLIPQGLFIILLIFYYLKNKVLI
jgi:hypothetical protein